MEQDDLIGICAGNMLKINNAGVLLKKQQFHDYRELEFDDLFLNLKPGCAAPTMLMRTDIVREVSGYDPELKVEDVYMQLKISQAGYKIVSINEICSYYRVHDNNMHNDYRLMIENVLQTFAYFKDRENYQLAVNNFLESMFVKVARKDRKLAWEVFTRIKPKKFSMKLIRGLIKMVF
jgi:alpha-1,3-rhamnosyltransferase